MDPINDNIPLTVELDTLRLVGGMAGLFGVAAFAYAGLGSHDMGALAIVGAAICGLGAGYALIGLGKAPCPECGYMASGLMGLKNNDSIECKGCGAYFKTEDGQVAATAADAIERFPVFATACPRELTWPDGCCVCGATATDTAPVRLELKEDAPLAQDMLTRAATLGTFKLVGKRTFEVNVPVCGEHGENCAELDFRYDEAQLYLRFRSRAYAKAFGEINGPVFWDS